LLEVQFLSRGHGVGAAAPNGVGGNHMDVSDLAHCGSKFLQSSSLVAIVIGYQEDHDKS
jgi:hypothetical protein